MKSMNNITNIKGITLEWLNNFFISNSSLPIELISSFNLLKLTQTSRCFLYEMTIKAKLQGLAKIKYMKFIIKDYSPILKLSKKLRPGIQKEAQFYQQIAPLSENTSIIPCYYAYYKEEPFDAIVILKNLSKTHKTFMLASNQLEKSHIEQMLFILAKFHSKWWDRHELRTKIPMNTKNENIRKRDHIALIEDKTEFFKFFERLKKILLSWLKIASSAIFPETMETYTYFYDNFPNLFWKRIKDGKNITLINGDSHPFQFYFPLDQSSPYHEIMIGDWEAWSVNIGIFDVAYMLGLFLSREQRLKWNEKSLVKFYHECLLNEGISNYKFSDCYYDYQLGLINNLYIPIWNNNPKMFKFSAIQALVDNNCKELME